MNVNAGLSNSLHLCLCAPCMLLLPTISIVALLLLLSCCFSTLPYSLVAVLMTTRRRGIIMTRCCCRSSAQGEGGGDDEYQCPSRCGHCELIAANWIVRCPMRMYRCRSGMRMPMLPLARLLRLASSNAAEIRSCRSLRTLCGAMDDNASSIR